MSVIFTAMAVHPLGPFVGYAGNAVVVVPSRRFGEYLGTMCGLVRRYGASEPTVMVALLRLLENCAIVVQHDWTRLSNIADQAKLILADAEAQTRQSADVEQVRRVQEALLRRIGKFRLTAE